ncbi:hydrogenase maturation protease [Wenjunlia tyrosinilytica]|uniref:Hydrogenase maturation protease n=1 Tax=Wenjunlia tyrosinilytica TaxID=1544741 RepID=A0A918DYD5_9ACTN|nr:hydrogenase maturation protease [Wenjunlia tyrosinilytica]GGO87939.1 hypothetical protein GCM10012280_27570 [Wenjunlia tyrosinilytica]
MSTASAPRVPSADRTLVAGVGNIFLGDDGFGVETVRRLAGHPLPEDVDVMDVGIRGVHLAYRLLEGYRRLVLVDTASRGARPGTVHLVEAPATAAKAPGPPMDGHSMDPAAVLALVHELREGAGGTVPEQVLVVGCEPMDLDEGIGLSQPVAQAVDRAVDLVLEIVRGPGPAVVGRPDAALTGDAANRPTDDRFTDDRFTDNRFTDDRASEGDGHGSDVDGRHRGGGAGSDAAADEGRAAGRAALPADPPDVNR